MTSGRKANGSRGPSSATRISILTGATCASCSWATSPKPACEKSLPGFTRTQLDWLEKVLSEPAPSRKFFFAHVPRGLRSRRSIRGWPPSSRHLSRTRRSSWTSSPRHHVVLAAFGHRHVHASEVYNGVLMIITGGGGQRNFVDPDVNEPRFTKKNHTLVDIPPIGARWTVRGHPVLHGEGAHDPVHNLVQPREPVRERQRPLRGSPALPHVELRPVPAWRSGPDAAGRVAPHALTRGRPLSHAPSRSPS